MNVFHLRTIPLLVASYFATACGGPPEASKASEPAEGSFEVINGEVILEGDIDLGTVEEVFGESNGEVSPTQVHVQSAGVFDRSRGFQGDSIFFPKGTPWPFATIPFRFADSVSAFKQGEFRLAVDHYAERTNLRWSEVAADYVGAYVLVKGDDTGSLGCRSSLGRRGNGVQDLQVGRADCNFGSMVHEMGHAAGLIHEHQRPDRDAFVTVNLNDSNWGKETWSSVATFGDYDIRSIMHYCTGQGGEGSITTTNGEDIDCQRSKLTAFDILGLQIMYGSEFEPTITTASSGDNRLDAFVRGTDGAVYQRRWDGSNWVDWRSLGGYIIGNVEVVSWGPGRYDLFARGSDGALYHRWTNDNVYWGDWTYLGGDLESHFTAVSWGPGRIDIFGKSTSTGAVLHKSWDNNGGWGPSETDFEDLGGKVVGPIQAVARPGHQLYVFAVGTNQALYYKRWINGWDANWQSLGGRVLGRISVVDTGSSDLGVTVVVKSDNDEVYYKSFNGSVWKPSVAGWSALGGDIVGNPTTVAWGPYGTSRLDIVAQSRPNGTLLHKGWNGSGWGSWTELWGGKIIGSPSAVAQRPGRLDVFMRGADNAMLHRSLTAPALWTEGVTRGGNLSW